MLKSKLNRTLGLPLVTLYGLGNILGAGIYVLVGKVAGYAGNSTTLAFLVAMVIATLTAFSYMELAGRYPVSASISVYLHKAFGRRWLSVLIGLVMVGGGIASAAALAQGFSGYLNTFITTPTIVASTGLLLVLGFVALKGIGESAKVASIFTGVEILGLLLIVWFGKSAISTVEVSTIFKIDPAVGISGVISGAFLAFYAFIGFEDMVNVAEETKNPKKTMPLAILASLIISTVLYILVVVISTALVSPQELAASSAPLTTVFERSGANHQQILSVIGMTAAINGVIVQLIMGSRVLYGLATQGWITDKLAVVHDKNKTPTRATLLVLALMVIGTIALPLVSLAQLTSLLVLSIFTLVNLSLAVIKRRGDEHSGYISVPRVIPYLGVLVCSMMIIYQVYSWF